MRHILLIATVSLLLLTVTGTATARVKLVALPERGAVTIRMDNPAATLIEEERVLTLQKGLNRVDFSWAGVRIDPDSIRLRMLTHPDRVALLNVSYPPGEAALVWEIQSESDWEETVRVSYLLAGIDRLIRYKAVADKAERSLDFRSYLVLRNFSGEDFTAADIQTGIGRPLKTDTRFEETRQLLLASVGQVPIEKVWTFDARVQPWDPDRVAEAVGIPVSYRIGNRKSDGLGGFDLPAGKMRLFQEDGSGSTIFLGEDRIALVPVNETVDIRIGDSRDIVVTQRKIRENRINVRRNKDSRIVLYDMQEEIHAEIENFKDQPATLTLVEYIPGHWEMTDCNMTYTLRDYQTLEFTVELPPKGKQELTMAYIRRHIR